MASDSPLFTLSFVGGPWHGKWMTTAFCDQYLPPVVGHTFVAGQYPRSDTLHLYQLTYVRVPMLVARYLETTDSADAEVPILEWL
jgi:hypothetical protein